MQATSDEAKTVLDLLHSLGVEDDMIMFDNFGMKNVLNGRSIVSA